MKRLVERGCALKHTFHPSSAVQIISSGEYFRSPRRPTIKTGFIHKSDLIALQSGFTVFTVRQSAFASALVGRASTRRLDSRWSSELDLAFESTRAPASSPRGCSICTQAEHITRPAQPQPRPNLDNRSSLAYRFLIILTLVSFVNGDSKLTRGRQAVTIL